MLRKRWLLPFFLTCFLLSSFSNTSLAEHHLTDLELLGKFLFVDERLSTPARQGCVTCHHPATGFTSPDSDVNEFGGPHPGAVPNRFGPRKPPSIAYSSHPDLALSHLRIEAGFGGDEFVGGLFWDGRATGEVLGDPLADQALGPFTNPVEQNVRNKKGVVRKVAFAKYSRLFKKVWGRRSLHYWKPETVETAYNQIALAIAAFERSSVIQPYTSKFDYWLREKCDLTDQEKLGMWLFDRNRNLTDLLIERDGTLPPSAIDDDPNTEDIEEGNRGQGLCSFCHATDFVEITYGNGITAIGNGLTEAPLFTDFTYSNIGTPKNEGNPFYYMPECFNPDGEDYVDMGLYDTVKHLDLAGLQAMGYTGETEEEALEFIEEQKGAHKVPTIRNVNLRPYPKFVKSYGHNGYFKTMEEIVHFYNVRDNPDEARMEFPEPEVEENVNRGITGDLGMTEEEELAIVAFMAALSDGYTGEDEHPKKKRRRRRSSK